MQLQGQTLQAAADAGKAFLPNGFGRWPLISPTANPVILQISKHQSEAQKKKQAGSQMKLISMRRNGDSDNVIK